VLLDFMIYSSCALFAISNYVCFAQNSSDSGYYQFFWYSDLVPPRIRIVKLGLIL
jgi:hypothetical protein